MLKEVLDVVFRKHASYIRQGRAGYQLQRGVPKALQEHIGRTQWKEPGGKTLREAQARVSGFLDRTDRAIAEAKGEVKYSTDEVIDLIPKAFKLTTSEDVEDLVVGIEILKVEGGLTRDQADRAIRIARGQEEPRKFLTARELIEQATRFKSPAARTKEGWEKALFRFMDFAQVAYPTEATREHAVAFRTHLLEKLAPSTTSVTLSYLAGLWSILLEIGPNHEHIFKGLTKSIKTRKTTGFKHIDDLELVSHPHTWNSTSKYLPIFWILYFTGCRLAEVCGLRASDIMDDRIRIRSHEKRPIKTSASARDIPIHPDLFEVLQPLRRQPGLIWANLQDGNRWGHNLPKPCKQITGTNPHGLRHRAATKLRLAGVNEAVIGRLLGHMTNTVTGGYGSIPWERLVDAVNCLGDDRDHGDRITSTSA